MKKKNIALDAGTIDDSVSNSVVEKICSKDSLPENVQVPVTEVVEFKTKYIDAEIQKKLDAYDLIEAQNVTLLKEKGELETKIAEYIEENACLKKTCDGQSTNLDMTELNQLKNKISQLEQTSAQYLRRISDLTFENATLTAQLKELSMKKTQVLNTIPSIPVRDTRLESAPYDPYQQNGYSDWN